MKFVQELRKVFDARLVIIATTTIMLGFGVAHWIGLQAAADSTGGSEFASLAYDIAFGNAAWTAMATVITATVIVSFATGVRSDEARRLALQLLVTFMIFATLNLALLSYRSGGI